MNPILIIVGIGLLIALVGGRRQRSQTVVVGAIPAPGGNGKGPTAVGQFEPEVAMALAVPFGQDCAEFQNGFDQELCRAFQGSCGIEVDGDYNPETAGALEYWLKKTGNEVTVPPSSTGKLQYFPPGASVNEMPAVGGPDDNAASYYAPICAEAVSVGRGYRADALRAHCVRTFQLAAGLVVDGLYGPKTREAVKKWCKSLGVPVPIPSTLFGK